MENENATLIRFNKSFPEISEINKNKTIAFDGDILNVMRDILK